MSDDRACPKCTRSWPVPCEQTCCIDLYGECMVCRFGIGGTGTADEVAEVMRANLAAAELGKSLPTGKGEG